ncbi:MAG: hypothetical protein LZ173_06640, partial [Thaumarchaeota archaeon]|nr:hypothetical protein [Candidatus Geocrenenecus arthurdayi]
LGFTPNRNEGRYNHRLRKHVAALAVNLYINAKKNKYFRYCYRDSQPSTKRTGTLQNTADDIESSEDGISSDDKPCWPMSSKSCRLVG